MKWRLQEGRGEAVYQIGVEDNGLLVGLAEEEMRASLKTLHRMAEKYASHSPSVLLTWLWRRRMNTTHVGPRGQGGPILLLPSLDKRLKWGRLVFWAPP